MNIGMLWFDSNDEIAVSKRVERAASYYKEKYGRVATLCFVRSGDDVLLMRRVAVKTNWRIRFNADPLGVVPSLPHLDGRRKCKKGF